MFQVRQLLSQWIFWKRILNFQSAPNFQISFSYTHFIAVFLPAWDVELRWGGEETSCGFRVVGAAFSPVLWKVQCRVQGFSIPASLLLSLGMQQWMHMPVPWAVWLRISCPRICRNPFFWACWSCVSPQPFMAKHSTSSLPWCVSKTKNTFVDLFEADLLVVPLNASCYHGIWWITSLFLLSAEKSASPNGRTPTLGLCCCPVEEPNTLAFPLYVFLTIKDISQLFFPWLHSRSRKQ